jgi:hypothetical protein
MGHRRVAADAGECFRAAGRSQRTSFRKEGEEPRSGTVDIGLPNDFTTVQSALSYNAVRPAGLAQYCNSQAGCVLILRLTFPSSFWLRASAITVVPVRRPGVQRSAGSRVQEVHLVQFTSCGRSGQASGAAPRIPCP